MKRIFLIGLFFTAYLFAFGEAHAFKAGAGAGVYIPSSDVDELGFPIGCSVNAHVDRELIPMLSLRLSADYSESEFKKYGYSHEFSTYGGALLLVATPPIPVFDVYAAAGYNGHWSEYETNNPLASSKGSDFGHGVVVQAGVGMGILVLHLGINAQYYIAEGDFDAGGFTVGLGLGLSL